MPLLAIPTTIREIQSAFVVALESVTPRDTRQQLQRWKYFSRDHDPVMGTRWFRFEWDPAGFTEGGFMWRDGASQSMVCSIVTDYGSLPEQEIDLVANDDHNQAWDVLDNLRLTTDGLRRVKSSEPGWAISTDSKKDQVQVVHQYLVQYLQARAS